MLRAIREIQPRWVVGENVRGLTNWNGGLVFDEVQADLENEGYEVTPYLLPACAVNAPHRRDRIWFVAFNANGGAKARNRTEQTVYDINKGADSFGVFKDATNADSFRQDASQRKHEKQPGEGREYAQHDFEPDSYATNAKEAERKQPGGTWSGREGLTDICPGQFDTDPCKTRQQRIEQHGTFNEGIRREQPSGSTTKFHQIGDWQQFPNQSPVRCRNDGISDGLVGITFSKHREKSIGAYGNAIVPQVALQIFKAIQEYENLNKL